MQELFTSASGESATLAELLDYPGLTDPSAQKYVTYLTTSSLENLTLEPSLLQTQSHHLISSITSLTHASYPTFLALHGTTNALTTSLESLSGTLKGMIKEDLPAVEDSASAWRGRTEGALSERAKARLVLEQSDKLRDLLDIPVLIETCVRNGYFQEALSLAAHAETIWPSSTFPPSIVQSILAEVRLSINHMLLLLLSNLKDTNRKLPALWKSVNFLRKMDVFPDTGDVGSEELIAKLFLSGREQVLIQSLDTIERDVTRLLASGNLLGETEVEDLTRHTKKFIDNWREGVYDILTQFTTIFLESANITSSPAPLHALASAYVTQSLSHHLLPPLRMILPHLPLGSLPSILTQLTYCASSFGRVGFDFRGILSDLFAAAIINTVVTEFRSASAKFTRHFSAQNPRPGRGKSELPPISSFLSDSTNTHVHAIPTEAQIAENIHAPPVILATVSPIAEITNNLLIVLNNFRLLAPVSRRDEVLDALNQELVNSGQTLLDYLRSVTGNAGGGSGEVKTMGDNYFLVFVPFARLALISGVYGKATVPERDSALSLMHLVDDWKEFSLTLE